MHDTPLKFAPKAKKSLFRMGIIGNLQQNGEFGDKMGEYPHFGVKRKVMNDVIMSKMFLITKLHERMNQ